MQLGMTPKSVQVWFQNRRQKLRGQQNAMQHSAAIIAADDDCPPSKVADRLRAAAAASSSEATEPPERLRRSWRLGEARPEVLCIERSIISSTPCRKAGTMKNCCNDEFM